MKKKCKKFLHKLLKLTVFVKAFDGAVDIIASIILLAIGPNALATIIPYLFRKELIEDPQDFIANYFFNISSTFSTSTHTFVIVYLMIHGVIKIGLGMTLMSKKHHIHFAAGIILVLLIVYESFRYTHTESLILLGAMLFDIFTLILIHYEFKKAFREKNSPLELG